MNLVSHLLLSIARKHAHRLRRNLSVQHRRGKRLYKLVDSPPTPSRVASSGGGGSSQECNPGGGTEEERESERLRLAEAEEEAEWIRKIRHRTTRHPRSARWRRPCRWPCVRDGETALHAACRRSAPPEVVRAVLEAYPPAAGLRSRGGEGYTPLHALCAASHSHHNHNNSGSSGSGSRTDNGNGNGDRDAGRRRQMRSREERQLGCMEVLLATSHGRGALWARDAFGRTPLHLLCLRNGPPDMVRFLLESAASASSSYDSDEDASDDSPSGPHPSPLRSNFLTGRSRSHRRRSGGSSDDGFSSIRRRRPMVPTEGEEASSLSPPSPSSLLVMQDAMGNTPLHYAASRGCPEETVRLLLTYDDDCLVDHRNSHELVGGGVRAKRAATVRNRSGCLPLHYGCYCAPARPGVLRLLVWANPTAVCIHSGNNHNSHNRRTNTPSNTNANGEDDDADGTNNEEDPDELGDDTGEDDGDDDDGEEEVEDDDDDDFESVNSPVAMETAAWGAAAGVGATPLDMLWRRYAFGPEDVAILSSVTSVDQIRGGDTGGGGGGGGDDGKEEGDGLGEIASSTTAIAPPTATAAAACTRGGPIENLWEDATAMLRASRVVLRRGGLLGRCDPSYPDDGDGGGSWWCLEEEEDCDASDAGVAASPDVHVLDGDVMRVLHAVAATRGVVGGSVGGARGRRSHRGRRRRRGGRRGSDGEDCRDDGRMICPRGMVELIDRLFDTLVRDAVAASSPSASHKESGDHRERVSPPGVGGGRGDDTGDSAPHGDTSVTGEMDDDGGSLPAVSFSSSSTSLRRCDPENRRRGCPPSISDLFVGAIDEVGMRWDEGLDELWRADPEILGRPVRHGRHGVVYPFALAGCVGRHRREPPPDVDTIYQLIRRRPDVIRMGIVP